MTVNDIIVAIKKFIEYVANSWIVSCLTVSRALSNKKFRKDVYWFYDTFFVEKVYCED